jgi:hypothetical protein
MCPLLMFPVDREPSREFAASIADGAGLKNTGNYTTE